MAYTLPNFNTPCDIYTGPWLTRVLRATVNVNLAMGRRVTPLTFPIDFSDGVAGLMPCLLLEPLTDIRDNSTGGLDSADVVDCPAGSGRWYIVTNVDDIGKGFPNEHRCASIVKIYESYDVTRFPGLYWPIPIP